VQAVIDQTAGRKPVPSAGAMSRAFAGSIDEWCREPTSVETVMLAHLSFQASEVSGHSDTFSDAIRQRARSSRAGAAPVRVLGKPRHISSWHVRC
jgi:hypothetical protein